MNFGIIVAAIIIYLMIAGLHYCLGAKVERDSHLGGSANERCSECGFTKLAHINADYEWHTCDYPCRHFARTPSIKLRGEGSE